MNEGRTLLMFRREGDTYVFDHIATCSPSSWNGYVVNSDKIQSKSLVFFNEINSYHNFLLTNICSPVYIDTRGEKIEYAYYELPKEFKWAYDASKSQEEREKVLEYINKLCHNVVLIPDEKVAGKFKVVQKIDPAEITSKYVKEYRIPNSEDKPSQENYKTFVINPEKNEKGPNDPMVIRSMSVDDFKKIKTRIQNMNSKDFTKLLSNVFKDEDKYKEKIEELRQRSLGIHEIGRMYEQEAEHEVNLDKKESNITDSIDVNEMIDQIKRKLVGQEEAVTSVVSNIYANQKIIETGNRGLISTQKAAILLDGSTGTGKTAIIKEVSERLSIPMVVTNSTSYSTTGYVGSSITDILSDLLKQANGDLELAQRGIVCIDEIEKLGKGDMEKGIAMRQAVQDDLLGFISGAKYKVRTGGMFSREVDFDTTNLTVICMGAFTDLRSKKIKEKEKSKVTIGFNREIEDETKIEDKTYTITAQDYVEYGLKRELIGRFSLLASTKTYTVEDYKKILLESEISPLKNFIEFAKSFGIDEVTYDDEFIQKAAEMAYEDNFGARGLHQIVSNIKNTLLLDIINSQSKTIHITTEMLTQVRERNKRRY